MEAQVSYDVIEKAVLKLENLRNNCTILKYKSGQLTTEIEDIKISQAANFIKLENMRLAATVLQNIVDVVSSKNIAKIENLVNSALSNIFDDMDIKFLITQDIKRNTNTYKIVLESNGIEGNKDSYGGGVVAVVAFILKIISNMLCKGYPIVVLDESLSFLSSKYIGNASGFIRELSEEFNLITVLVTHQPLFVDYADLKYEASNGSDGVVFNELKE